MVFWTLGVIRKQAVKKKREKMRFFKFHFVTEKSLPKPLCELDGIRTVCGASKMQRKLIVPTYFSID